MRKEIVALLCAIVAGLMLAPTGVSAGTSKIMVSDQAGDLMLSFDPDTCEFTHVWQVTTPVAKAGYFDILSFSLAQKGKVYTFEMQVAADLPKEGTRLPTGFNNVQWIMWIELEPWNPVYNNVDSLFKIGLLYDGSRYAAKLTDYATGEVLATLSYAIDGPKLQIQFSADSIGNLESFWWMPYTRVQWSVPPAGYWALDTTDPGAVPGQIWWDIPWGDPVFTP